MVIAAAIPDAPSQGGGLGALDSWEDKVPATRSGRFFDLCGREA